jgi:hypothetical protein
MSARPNLHLIVDHNGETTERCQGCIDKEAAIERLTNSYEGTIRDLRNQLRAHEPDMEIDQQVQGVLDFWADRVLEARWWTRRPRFEPGDPQWKATAAALHKKLDPPYLRLAVVGALLEADEARKQGRKFRRHWLKPEMIFRIGRVDTHYENAGDPRFEWVRAAREVPVPLRGRWAHVVSQADVCGNCDHLRFDHDRPRPLEGVFDPPCAVHGCDCCAFDESDVEAWRFLAGRDRLARERMGAG